MPQGHAADYSTFVRVMQCATITLKNVRMYLDDAIAHGRTPCLVFYTKPVSSVPFVLRFLSEWIWCFARTANNPMVLEDSPSRLIVAYTTTTNERIWSITDVKTGPIVWAIKRLPPYCFQFPSKFSQITKLLNTLPLPGITFCPYPTLVIVSGCVSVQFEVSCRYC